MLDDVTIWAPGGGFGHVRRALNVARRCRSQVIDADVHAHRALPLGEVLVDEAQACVLHVAHHRRGAVDSRCLAHEADGAVAIDTDRFEGARQAISRMVTIR